MNRKERRAARKSGDRTGATAQAEAMFAEAVRRLQDGRPSEADALCRGILDVHPRHAGSMHLLGSLAMRAGRPDLAVEWLRGAVAADNAAAVYQGDLGLALHALGHTDDAEVHLRRAIRLASEQERSYHRNNLATVLLDGGRLADASEAFAQALAVAPDSFDENYQEICDALYRVSPAAAGALQRATSAWPRRLDDRELLAPSAMAALAGNPLLRCMLVSAPVRDIGLEILLTAIRRALLLRAADGGDDAALALGSALARQCFVNEYVFSTTPEEDAAAERLKQSIGDAIAGRSGIDAMTLALAGCYFALSSLPGAERLLDRKWPAPLDAVLTQQLREPLEERRLSESMPRLTAIADATSLRVREQYEANPYPRWVLAPPAPAPAAVDDYFRRRFPHAPLQATGVAEPEILVAGCGTGQQPIGMARRFSGARVLAIDLSLASLGYARRKSNELGIRNIDHAQADILELPSLGRTFDIVDSRGVLHHLADPEAGWRALLSMLRPRGLMAVGLYSEAARRQVAAARAFCMERGFQATARDIAACRHALLSAGFRSFEMVNDFFTVSECRDLLFHVSEQQFTVARIRSLLGGGAVRLIGFDVPAAVAAAYRQRFPGDPAMCDLANWERVENERPDTFAGMYQFWVQKA